MTNALKMQPDEVIISTRLFGEIAVPQNAVIEFPHGLPGFDQNRKFALLPSAVKSLFWMQSLDNPTLSFLLADIADLIPEAEGVVQGAMAIVTLPSEDGQATVNLRAPLVVDRAAGLAAQVIAADNSLSTTHPFDLAGLLQ